MAFVESIVSEITNGILGNTTTPALSPTTVSQHSSSPPVISLSDGSSFIISQPFTTTTSTFTTSPVPTSVSNSPTPGPPTALSTSHPTQSISLSTDSSSSSTRTDSPAPIFTTIDGHATTVYSQLPTNLSSSNAFSSSHRAILIASTAIGSILFFVFLLLLAFFYKRHQRKKLGLVDSLTSTQKKQIARANLLDGEDFDDDNHNETPHMAVRNSVIRPRASVYSQYGNDPSQWNAGGGGNDSINSPSIRSLSPTTPVAPLLRSRGSQTGSIFHEAVWPPPGESSKFVDPFVKANSEVDLGKIVNDVMGNIPRRSSFGPSRDVEDGTDAEVSGDVSPTFPSSFDLSSRAYGGVEDGPPRPRSFASSSTSALSGHLKELSSNASFARLQPKNSSPLTQVPVISSSEISSAERASPRNWLERSPKHHSVPSI